MYFCLVGRLLNNQGKVLKDKDMDAHLEELDEEAINAIMDELEKGENLIPTP